LSGHLSLAGGEEHFPFTWNETIAEQNSDNRSGEEDRADDGVNNGGNHDRGHRLGIVGGNDARPESDDAEKDLETSNGVKPDAGAGDFGDLWEAAAKYGSGPEDHREDNRSAKDVWLEREIAVSKTGADKDLKKNDDGVEGNDAMNGRRALVFILREVLHPPAAGEASNGHQDGKDELGRARVQDGQPVVEEFENSEAAENALKNDSTESGEAEVANERTFIVAPEERGQDDG